ncbi:MAG: hypothetical protein KAS90_01525 [Candidatus Aenigmarchaeota archaeon]|nr:hypothetical protein [Candidatus Aenigmarchaeota archaeon]
MEKTALNQAIELFLQLKEGCHTPQEISEYFRDQTEIKDEIYMVTDAAVIRPENLDKMPQLIDLYPIKECQKNESYNSAIKEIEKIYGLTADIYKESVALIENDRRIALIGDDGYIGIDPEYKDAEQLFNDIASTLFEQRQKFEREDKNV